MEYSVSTLKTNTIQAATGSTDVGQTYFKTYIRLLRGSTVLSVGDAASNRPQVYAATHPGGPDWDSYSVTPIPLNLLDSPNTTSSVTYKVDFRPYQHTVTTSYINRCGADRDNADYDERSISVITLQEIAG